MSSGVNQIDVAILIVLILSSAFGLWRGLIKEVLSVVTWIAAIMVARLYNAPVAELFSGFTESPTIRYVSAFAILFIGTMMLGTLLKHLLSKLITISGLKLADKILGAGFGFARGALIVMVVMFIAQAFVSDTQLWQQSMMIPYGEEAIEWSRTAFGDFDATSFMGGEGLPSSGMQMPNLQDLPGLESGLPQL